MPNDDDPKERHGDTPAKPGRDIHGRWLKGHCPNPNGRPRKQPKGYFDQADVRVFANTPIEVRTNGRTETMDRRTALMHKIFEDAMKGKASAQRLLDNKFERNSELLAATRVRLDQLEAEYIIDNDKFDGLDGENIPYEVQSEIAELRAVLHNYFPEQYPRRESKVAGDDTD